MKNPDIALLMHANLNHLSLSAKQRDIYCSHVLSEMISQVRVPVMISLPAEDLLYLSKYYPDAFSNLVCSPVTSFLLSTYAHVIADHSYDSYEKQAKLGQDVFSNLIPADKLSSIAYPSEVELPTIGVLNSLSHLWKGLILGETRVKISSQKQVSHDMYYHVVSDNLELPVYMSRRKTGYREQLHRFFREETSAESVVVALQEDALRYADNVTPHVARIDLEVPLFNDAIYSDGRRSGPRVDLWNTLLRAFERSDIRFLSSLDLQAMNIPEERRVYDLTHDSEEEEKWQSPLVEETIMAAQPQEVSWAYQLWLSLQASDYLCSELPDFLFVDSEKEIRITKKQEHRRPEREAKMEYLFSPQTAKGKSSYVDRIAQLVVDYEGGNHG